MAKASNNPSKVPDVLYKYLNWQGAVTFLVEPQIRFKDYRKLDDLMESFPGRRQATEREAVREARLQQRSNPKIPFQALVDGARHEGVDDRTWEREMRSGLGKLRCGMYVCSMSERSDSGAMWSHYCDDHTGIVFGISSTLRRLGKRGVRIEHVRYSNDRPTMPGAIYIQSVLDRALKTKSTDWTYQREWRLFADPHDTDFGRGSSLCDSLVEPLARNEISEIFIGYRADDTVRKLAFAAMATGTKVFETFPHPTEQRMKHQLVGG